jgi:O-Antigen ligase
MRETKPAPASVREYGSIAMKHLLVVAVAVVYVALSLANGGYSHELIAGASVAIWWGVVIALVLRAWPRSPIPGPAIAAGLLLAAFAGWTAVSIDWASDHGGAFIEVVRVLGYLGLFVLVAVASPRASVRAWLTGLALGLAVVAGLALASRFEPSFGGQHVVGRFLPAALGRLTYPIGYWNGLGACMAIASVLFVWLGAHARTLAARALAVAALPLAMLTIYFASSRGGVAAGVVGLVALLAFGPARSRMLAGLALGGAAGAGLIVVASRKHELVSGFTNAAAAHQGDQMLVITLVVIAAVGLLRLAVDRPLERFEVPRPVTIAALFAVAVAIVIGVIVANPSARWHEFKAAPPLATKRGYVASHLASGNGSGRYQYWGTALDAFRSEPGRGIGAGGYGAYWNQHGSLTLQVRDAHSLYLETLGELGIVGLVLLLAFLAVPAVSGLLRDPGGWPGGEVGAALAVLAAGLTSAALDWTWELPACFAPVVLVAALLTGPATLPGARGSTPGASRAARRSRLVLGIATVLAGIAAIWAAGLLFFSLVKVGDSQDAVDRGDLPAAAQDARDAITFEPWAADPRLQLALVEELGGDLRAANHDLDQAIDRAPDNWQLWFVKARIAVKLGNGNAARHALARARELNPRAPFLATSTTAAGP